jgi:autotransporter-associated beta strand protein
LRFDNTGTTTLLGDGVDGSTLTLGTGGITLDASAGAVTLGDGTAANDVLVSLTSGAQTWTNNSAAAFTFNNSAATFSRATGATLVFAGSGNFAVTSGVSNDATGIIGPWAFFGTGTNTRYAYNNAGNIAGFSGGSATTQGSWTSATTNYEVNTTTGQTLGGSRTMNTLRYSGTGVSITLGSSGANTLTTNGILAVGASGTLTITRSGTSTGTVIAGSTGEIVIAGPQAVDISAPISSGALTYAGTGRLTLTGTNTYTGKTTVSGGIVRFGNSYTNTWGTSLNANSNLEINNGIVEAYYYLTRTLGTAAGQIQFTGGRAGITNLQGDASATYLTFTNTSTTVNWGDAAFNPSTLVVNGAGASAPLRMANPFNLNGAARTVEVAATGVGGGNRGTYGVFERALTGAGGSLTKTGVGTLMLDGANTYNGGTAINAGGLWFNRLTAMPASGAVTVNDGGILSVSVGGGWPVDHRHQWQRHHRWPSSGPWWPSRRHGLLLRQCQPWLQLHHHPDLRG